MHDIVLRFSSGFTSCPTSSVGVILVSFGYIYISFLYIL